MNNQKIIITIGISGSGKSSWATDYIESNPSFVRVNRDSIRQQITGTDNKLLNKDLENLVTKIQDEQIRTILSNGYNSIIDNTHLKEKYINEIIKSYNHLADIQLEPFYINVEDAKERVIERDTLQESDVKYINNQFESFLNLKLKTLYFPKIEINPYIHTSGLQECIICDLDGTLSLYNPNLKSAYDRDFENDEVNYSLLHILKNWVNNNYYLFFFSGRNSKFELQTRQFLNKYFLEEDYILIMRDEKDMRRDSIIKLEMFDNHIRNKYNVISVFDDRLQVIEECWNPLRVFVFNCNQGNKRF